MNDQGGVIAAWKDPGWFATTSPDRVTWSAEQGISGPQDLGDGAVAVEPKGRAVALWAQGYNGVGGGRTVTANVFEPAHLEWPGTYVEEYWSGPTRIHAATGDVVPLGPHTVDFDQNGNAVVAWVWSDPDPDVWVSRYEPQTGWDGPTLLREGTSANGRQVWVRGLDGGGILAVWWQDVAVHAARYSPAKGDWLPAQMGIPLGSTNDLMLDLDASGRTVATWSTDETWVATFDGYSWSTPLQLTVGQGTAGSPQAAVSANGRAVVAWHQANNIYASRYDPAEGWTEPELLEAFIDPGVYPSVGIDSAGNAIVVWWQTYPMNGTQHVYMTRWTNNTASWSPPAPLDQTDTNNTTAPRILMTPSGIAFVYWYKDGVTRYRRFE